MPELCGGGKVFVPGGRAERPPVRLAI